MNVTRREFLAMSTFLALAGCSNSNGASPSDASDQETVASESSEATTTDTVAEEESVFDGSGLTEAGNLTFYLATAGGTTEGGNIPQILVDPNSLGAGVDVCIVDGDGSICVVYIDGHERLKLNAGNVQSQIIFEESDATEGVHLVELVSDSDGGTSIYKTAEYEVIYG